MYYFFSIIPLGNVYIADNGNHRLRKITVSTNVISTIVGVGATSYNGDGGQATSASIDVSASALDSAGNMYIADNGNHRIRKVAVSTTIISTIAGNGGTGSYSGDGGQATSAALNYPITVALDSAGITSFSFPIDAFRPNLTPYS